MSCIQPARGAKSGPQSVPYPTLGLFVLWEKLNSIQPTLSRSGTHSQKTPIHTDESSQCLHSWNRWSNENTDTWEVEQYDKSQGSELKILAGTPVKFAFVMSGREWDKGGLEKEESGSMSAGM